MDFELERWCDTACSHIRFRPDRVRVKQELLWHMEDKLEALADSGKTLMQKRETVLKAMGNADAVGKALAKEHKPWLGWLWLASRRILIFTMIIALFCSSGSSRLIWDGNRSYYDRDFSFASTSSNQPVVEKPNVAKVDGYTIRLTRVAKWVSYSLDVDGQRKGSEELDFTIDTTNWLPWLAEPAGLSFLTAVDSEGNSYTHNVERGERTISGDVQWRGLLFFCRFEMRIQGLAPDAKWIELQYRRSSRNFSFRILLPGGADQ